MADGCGRSADAAAYALGALEPGEAEEFRAHMQTCPACREDVAGFQGVTLELPDASVQYAVPKGLRKRVLKEVRATPHDGAPARARRPVLIPRRALGAFAGAVAVAVAVIVGIAIGSSGGGGGTRVIQAQVIGAPGSARLQITSGRGELVLRGLPAPGAGRIYEVWFERGRGRPSPTNTLFSVSSVGAGDVGLAGSLNGISEVLVTSEPAGGSRVPTSPALIVARLT
ncbi:MAG TPA: anti-sigma factor [Solirubrobacteraceae bacterium]|nr:anti-sigma factor [Solirubrobacteraceae bacterium]